MPDNEFNEQQGENGEGTSNRDKPKPANEDEKNEPGKVSGEQQPAWRPTDEDLTKQDDPEAGGQSRAQGTVL